MLRVTKLKPTTAMKVSHGLIYALMVAITGVTVFYVMRVPEGRFSMPSGFELSTAIAAIVGLFVASAGYIVIITIPYRDKVTQLVAVLCATAGSCAIVVFAVAIFILLGNNHISGALFWAPIAATAFWSQFFRLTDLDVPRATRYQMWAQQNRSPHTD